MSVQDGVCSRAVGPVILRASNMSWKQSGPVGYRVLCYNASPLNEDPFMENAAM